MIIKNNIIDCQNNTLNYYQYFFSTIYIILYFIIIISLSNIEKLSNCDCSKLPYKDYIKEWFTFLIIKNISLLIIFSLSDFECYRLFLRYPIILYLKLTIFLINIIMYIRLFIYLYEIRKNCNCAYGKKEAFLFWFLILYIALLLIMFFLLLFLLILFFMFNKI